MESYNPKKSKKGLVVLIILLIIVALGVTGYIVWDKVLKDKLNSNQTNAGIQEVEEEQPKEEVDIINIESKTRPFAIVINNTPVAVKVQEGLNKAYLIYEIPTEGNTSRIMALYKDAEDDLTIGTIRSSRHNFLDYALESDAIYVHYGWSHYAKSDEQRGVVDYINGLFDTPFWRNNPERLASEHTAYTSISKLKDYAANKKKFNMTSDKDTVLLNYNVADIDLSEKEGAKKADKVVIPYGSKSNEASFTYNEETGMYERREAGNYCIDYKTKERVSTKNIIVQKVSASSASDGYYWDIKTVGTGKGYFITNGYAVPITWEKTSRSAQTKYKYLDGTEIEVSDGRTYIELQTTRQELTIEGAEPVAETTPAQ